MQVIRLYVLVAAAWLAVVSCAAAAELTYQVPSGWRTEQPKSSMRLAQFALPKDAGDPEDAAAVIYFFGEGQGGGVDANLERWAGQMAQAGGRPGTVKDGRKTSFTANGHTVTVIDITGTYTDMMSGAAAKAGFRMKAAVVETPGGAYFVKLTGPDKTVTKWDAAFKAFLQSMSYK
jgi:hypothetical protein